MYRNVYAVKIICSIQWVNGLNLIFEEADEIDLINFPDLNILSKSNIDRGPLPCHLENRPKVHRCGDCTTSSFKPRGDIQTENVFAL